MASAPPPQGGWRGAIGRPLPLELLHPLERRALERDGTRAVGAPPDGRGRRIVVVPGFGSSATSMEHLGDWLTGGGWVPVVAPIGRNLGPSEPAVAVIAATLADAVDADGAPVVVLGYSRGGQLARVVAVRHPDLVRGLVTLGSPHLVAVPSHFAVRLPVKALHLRTRRAGGDPEELERAFHEDRERPFPAHIPFVSIWTRRDGIVDWRTCGDPAAVGVEVRSTHRGLKASTASFDAIGDALAHIDARR